MNNDFSIEELIAVGTGFVPSKKTDTSMKSIENYSGFSDAVIADVTQASESLKFMDTYILINNKNANDKVKMLNRIRNLYGRNIYDNQAKNSIESYCMKNLYSAEEDANNTGSSTQNNDAASKAKTDASKKKGQFFKKIIEAIKGFLRKVIDFIKLIINKIKTFFGKFLAKNLDHFKLQDKNPFSEGEKVLDFSSYNLANAQKFVKTFSNMSAKIDEKSEGGDFKQTIDGGAEDDMARFIKKMKSQVKILDNIDNGQEGAADEAIAWEMFGMKMTDGNTAWKRANLAKIVRLSQVMNDQSNGLLNNLITVNEKINTVFGPIEKIASDLEAGRIEDTNKGLKKAIEKNQRETMRDNLKEKHGNIAGGFLGLFVRAKLNCAGDVVVIATSKNIKELCTFLRSLINVSNKTAAMANRIAGQIKKMIKSNDGVDEKYEEKQQKKEEKRQAKENK